jgi:uncharacterized protein YndB with AHSA1/START domain
MKTRALAGAAVAVVALGVLPGALRAEVVDSSVSGFTVHEAAVIKAPASTVWQTLTARVGQWWNPAHTYTKNAANLSITLTPGGCFCEKMPNASGVEHMRVIFVDAGKTLRMSGAIGPMQEHGLTGAMTWTLAEMTGETSVDLTYRVGGYFPGPTGVGAVAKPSDQVLGDALTRLKQLIETGKVGG